MIQKCSSCIICYLDFLYRELYRIPLLFGLFGNFNLVLMSNFSKIRYSLVFNRKDQLNQFGDALIQLRAYQNGKSRYFSTGIYIKPDQWDQRNCKIKHTHPNHFVYNQQINRLIEEIEGFEIKMINRHGSFPLHRLHEYQSKPENQKETISFTDFYEFELSNHSMKPDSFKMYKLTLSKLKAYKKQVYFEELNYSFISGFDLFLRKQNLGVNSIKQHHKRLRTFVNRAIKKDLLKIDDNPYKKFKPRSIEPERVFITKEELAKLETVNIPKNEARLKTIKDIFLFATYTGLRYSDVTNLRLGNVSQDARGWVLNLKAKKTDKSLKLPLYLLFRQEGEKLSRPEKILTRHLKQFKDFQDIEEAKRLRLFPISNQYFNRSLKTIAKHAGVNKKLTSHVARRTFATIMATKVKAPILQRLLQHSRPDMTNIYIQLSNHLVEEELQKVHWNEP